MTKMHFEMLAAFLRTEKASAELIKAMASALARTNPKFDRGRFIAAATPPPEPPKEWGGQ